MAKEYIEREALLDIVEQQGHVTINDIIYAPAADVVEVVRCKDCKYRADVIEGGNHLCNRKMLGVVRPMDFCSYGERRG